MAKTTTQFICQSCGAAANKWSGRCLACGEWGTLAEVSHQATRGAAVQKLTPQKLSAMTNELLSRIPTVFGEIDKVLGGGIVPGSLVLLSGDPGIGKSTLALQIAAHVAANKQVLYASGEESSAQIKLRADRIAGVDLHFDLVNSNDIDSVLALCSDRHYDLVIIDSIQTMFSSGLDSASGAPAQITNNTNQIARVARANQTAFVIVGHVTKEGNVAGPRLLEHLVDTVLYLEGERSGNFKLLRSVKNRFGTTREVGIFEMSERGLTEVKNPSAYLLRERQQLPGSIILATMEGSRPLLVEVQALVSHSVFGYPKRTAAGVDLNRLQLLAAVATKRGGLNLSDKDIYVNIVGGLKIVEPAVDIAIILSIASALKNTIPPAKLAVFGEVGLSGEIRSVNMADRRVSEARKMGFTTVLGPASVKDRITFKPSNITQAIEQLG